MVVLQSSFWSAFLAAFKNYNYSWVKPLNSWIGNPLILLTDHLLFLRSDDIIRLLEQNARLLNK